MKNGRLTDVYCEHVIGKHWEIYADPGHLKHIESVEGVLDVMYMDKSYKVWLDPRYSADFVISEIEAQIKINDPEVE